jgi:hypothetical protein
MNPLLWAATAFGHGGPPTSNQLLWGDSSEMMVASSHGFIFEDSDWDWVCEEMFGASLPTDVARTQDRIFVATTAGLAESTGGCVWNWNTQFEEELIWDLAVDHVQPDRLWLVSDTGLWHSDDAGTSFTQTPHPEPTAKLRSVIPMPNGQVTVLGFLDGQATAWQGDTNQWYATELEVRGGHLVGLGADTLGNVYGRFPRASGTDELLRIDALLEVTSVLETEATIGAFVVHDAQLMVSVNNEGTWVSSDQGDTWTQDGVDTFSCLVAHDDFIWGCPNDGSEYMWLRTDDPLDVSPKTWETGPTFSDVSEPRCGDELPECELIWPTVALELGINLAEVATRPEAADEPEPEKVCGCGAHAAVLMAPWWLLWAGYRRNDA